MKEGKVIKQLLFGLAESTDTQGRPLKRWWILAKNSLQSGDEQTG